MGSDTQCRRLGIERVERENLGRTIGGKTYTERHQYENTFLLHVVTLITIFLFFYFGVIHNFIQALIAFVVVSVIAFLFTTVAANAIAIVGTNPVSGMTLMTLILASVILVASGLSGKEGMVAALIIGGVVCTALSIAGGLVTDLKIGYWLGTTPAKQETWKFVGTLVAAATVGGVMIILNKTYGFTGENALAARKPMPWRQLYSRLCRGKEHRGCFMAWGL